MHVVGNRKALGGNRQGTECKEKISSLYLHYRAPTKGQKFDFHTGTKVFETGFYKGAYRAKASTMVPNDQPDLLMMP